MAENNKIQVELVSKLDQLAETHSKTTYKDSTTKEQIDALIKEGRTLLALSEPTNKQLTRLNSIFRQLSETIIKVASSTTTISKEMQKLQREEREAETELENKTKTLADIKKKGRVNAETQQFEFFNTTLDERVRGARLSTLKGKSPTVRTYETFAKHFDAEGHADASYFRDPAAAENLRSSLIQEQKDYNNKLQDLLPRIDELNISLKDLAEKIIKQEKEDTGTGGIIGPTNQTKTEAGLLINQLRDINTENKATNQATTNVDINSTLKKQGTSLGQAFKQFTLYAVAIRAAKTALREAVNTVKELDKYLTEQAMVTGKTRKETYALVGAYQKLALQTGATTKEIAGVATEYMKQGKSTKDALILTEAAVKAAKVARVSVGDSVNYLTTALNGFRLSAEDAMRVSDKFAAVAASSATDYDELAIALSKVASQANLAGMSIDYTTALLTKGLETTREAPETMGTALKTIIARMREMKDYGATLEGDTDINNVESQLAYVGIALKNQQGELRSTEEVLDELGKKWDTLNKNQQAALAKALAGTRQQSRLIAMMDDYERVTELQEIAQRSAGATSAQAGTYLEGMEAALNKIQVAWEKIVTTITNSELIIGIFNQLATVIDHIGSILSNPAGMVAGISLVAAISLNILGTKIKEQKIAKWQYEQSLKQRRVEIDTAQTKLKNLITEKQTSIEKREQLIATLEEEKLKEGITEEEKIALDKKIQDNKKLNDLDQQEIVAAKDNLEQLQWQDSLLKEQESLTGKLIGGFSGIHFLIKDIVKLLKQPKGWIGLIVAAVAAAGYGLYKLFDWLHYSAEEAAEDINKLSNDIYKLNEKANAIKEIDRKFSALDEKVIKTAKDVKEMNELLDSAKDKLTDEEKAQVNAFKTPQAQMAELRRIEKAARIEADEKRNEQIRILQSLNAKEREKLLTGTDSKSVEAQSAIRAKANNDLYEYIDLLKDEGKILEDNAKATEHITQAILDQMTAEEAAAFAEDPKKTQQLAGLLKDLSATSIFTDDAASLTNRVQAFKDIQVALTADEQAYQKFTEAFSEWDVFKDMSQSALEFIDAAGLSIDEINDLFLGYKKLQSAGVNVSKEDYQTRIKAVFDQVEDDFSNFNSVIEQQFGDLVSKTADGGKQWTALINAIGDQFATSVLDMGQNMEKFKNTISNFYEKSMKWNEMKESEKSQFISDNMDMFKGEGGDELLAAFESGNYNDIEAAIAQQMGKRQADILAEVNRSLAVEMAKPEAEQNKAYIRQLEQYKDFLTDKENLYKVSLKVQLEQEKQQIDEYKSYLQDQQKALEESLDKRKQAYQDYFDKINEQKEEEDFEEETQNLIANIGKLGADTNAATAKERAELVQQLEEKEKQHAEEMRQKAQEAVMKDLDTQVEEINKKFDKLLDSNHELLLAMNGELKDPSKFLGGLLSNKVAAGLTGNEMQNYLQELQGTYGSIIGRDSFEGLEFKERNGDLYLNVNGQEIMLNQNDQQSVFEAITTALRSIGHY